MHTTPNTPSVDALDLDAFAQMLDDAMQYRAGEGRCEHPWREPTSDSCQDCASDQAHVDKYQELAAQLRAIVKHHRSIAMVVAEAPA